MTLRVKNWTLYQQYKDRRPSWIKLHRELLDNEDFYNLSPDAARLLIYCWLLACDDPKREGNLPEASSIAWRLRLDQGKTVELLQELVVADFLIDSEPVKKRTKKYDSVISRTNPEPREEKRREETEERRARTHEDHDQEYVGEQRTDSQRMVAEMIRLWPDWPQDQIEPSVMTLRGADRDLSLDQWFAILAEAKRTMPPSHPAHKAHTWIANQVTIYKRDRARDQERSKPTGPASASFKEFTPDEDRPRTPEEQADIEAARAKLRKILAGQGG